VPEAMRAISALLIRSISLTTLLRSSVSPHSRSRSCISLLHDTGTLAGCSKMFVWRKGVSITTLSRRAGVKMVRGISDTRQL
jgi:hypothetical protein